MRSAVSTFLLVPIAILSVVSGFAGFVSACSSTTVNTGLEPPDGAAPLVTDKTGTEPPDGSSPADGDSGQTATGQDSGADAAVTTPSDGGCVVQTVDLCPQDDMGCDSLIALRNGREFCTMACESPEDCPQNAGVVCNASAGACLPPCTDDASCKAAGFFRCDTVGKTCTTL